MGHWEATSQTAWEPNPAHYSPATWEVAPPTRAGVTPANFAGVTPPKFGSVEEIVERVRVHLLQVCSNIITNQMHVGSILMFLL